MQDWQFDLSGAAHFAAGSGAFEIEAFLSLHRR